MFHRRPGELNTPPFSGFSGEKKYSSSMSSSKEQLATCGNKINERIEYFCLVLMMGIAVVISWREMSPLSLPISLPASPDS